MLFVQHLLFLLNGPILAFREEAGTWENINKVRESSNDGEQRKDEKITGAGDRGVVNQLALNTALLEGCRRNESSVCYRDQ